MSSDGKGYLLPDPIDPEATKCVQLAIPDDPYYWAAFWGQMEALGTWYTWERNDAKTGKEAAALWQDTIAAARAAWLIGDCPLQVRANPTEPCEHQYSVDGGESWITFATLTDCSPNVGAPAPFPEAVDPAGDSAASVAQWMGEIMCLVVAGIQGGDTDPEIISTVQAFVAAFAPHVQTADMTINLLET